MNKRQPPFRLFSVIVALLFCFQIVSAAPPAPSADSTGKVSQPARPPAWTIPENEAAYPALLMPQDHQGLNMIGYLKQTEDQALARYAPQGYVKAAPERAAKLEQALLTNIAFRLDVAGKTITAKENPAGARYVVVEKQKAATASPQPTGATPVKTASAAKSAVPKPGGQ